MALTVPAQAADASTYDGFLPGGARYLIDMLAQSSETGRARIALARALMQLPHWWNEFEPQPMTEPARETADEQTLEMLRLSDFVFDAFAELEKRAGGTPFTTVGMDYARLFEASPDRKEVELLHRHAGLDIADDLRRLNSAPRVVAAPGALHYLRNAADLSGKVAVPVLMLHTDGDQLVPAANERAYLETIMHAGRAELVRATFVHRAGHCTFTNGETLAALQVLEVRLNTGS
ncbi:MAG: hypothetical protein ACLPYS_11435 [Vulcanimicrobiaceae bacterium]